VPVSQVVAEEKEKPPVELVVMAPAKLPARIFDFSLEADG